MVRILAASALAVTAMAISSATPAVANSSGMSAEFPVGTCIDYRNDHLAFATYDLLYVTVVPCTDPGRDYRVTAQVANTTLCDPTTTNWEFTTRDNVVLCVVQDQVVAAPPVFGG